MYYINVQSLDYDDYPTGTPHKIGPFASEAAAQTFMENSSQFYRRHIYGDYSEWKSARNFGTHSVTIRSVTDGLTAPWHWA